MCGFSGFVGDVIEPKIKLSKCLDLLKHRGPDMSKYLYSPKNKIGLAHNRLSIIDISKNALQPFKDSIGNTLVFNGEIYNCYILKKKYLNKFDIKWKSKSDTEVLFNCLTILGIKKTLEIIEGMFSFAFFDVQTNSMFLARDIAGEKPLYFSKKNNTLFFSSETKPILYLLNKKKISQNKINKYLNSNFSITNETLYNDIKCLKPGTILKYDIINNKSKIDYFWNYEKKYLEIKKNNLFRQDKNFEMILEDSIKSQLVSDVPVGTFMSGGLDSTIVSSIASKYNKNLKIYSLGFEQKDFDESKRAEKIAKHLNQKFYKVLFKPNQLPDLFDSFIKKLDLPHTDQSDICLFYLCKIAKKNKTKVILTGDGGDELFAGYNRHIWISKILKMNRISKYFLKSFINIPLSIKLLNFLNNNFSEKNRQLDFESKVYKLKHVLNIKDINKIYLSLIDEKNNNIFKLHQNSEMSNLRNILRYDFDFYLPNNILYKSDSCSMYNSIELRAPFLSKKIIEYSLSLSDSEILSNSYGKIPLRKILNKYLPEELINLKKTGFTIPLADWLSNDLRDWAKEIFFNPVISDKFGINLNYKNHWDNFMDSPKNNFQKIWNIIIINSWLNANLSL